MVNIETYHKERGEIMNDEIIQKIKLGSIMLILTIICGFTSIPGIYFVSGLGFLKTLGVVFIAIGIITIINIFILFCPINYYTEKEDFKKRITQSLNDLLISHGINIVITLFLSVGFYLTGSIIIAGWIIIGSSILQAIFITGETNLYITED